MPKARLSGKVGGGRVRAKVRRRVRRVRHTLRDLIDGLARIETIARELRLDLEQTQKSIIIDGGSKVAVRPVVDGSCPPPK